MCVLKEILVQVKLSLHFGIIFYCEFIEHYQQQKNVSDKHSDKSAGTQSSAVSSIKIAKVQEDVEWENGGKKYLDFMAAWLINT